MPVLRVALRVGRKRGDGAPLTLALSKGRRIYEARRCALVFCHNLLQGDNQWRQVIRDRVPEQVVIDDVVTVD